MKAHLMCGVNTNVVPSVEITSSNGNDSTYLAPVVDSTAKRFNNDEVPGDKTYLSNGNLVKIAGHGATPYIPFKSNTVATGSLLREQMYHCFMLETIGR